MTILDLILGLLAGNLIAGFMFYLLGQYVSKRMKAGKVSTWSSVDIAVLAERERCAKIADDQSERKQSCVAAIQVFNDGWVDAAAFIADRIRSGE